MAKLHTALEIEKDSPFHSVYEWEAPERQWSAKTRTWYVVYSLFFVCIIFIGALLQEYIFIVAVITFSFLWFIQGSIAPNITTYSITSMGIKVHDKLFKWREIKFFWFSKKGDTLFLNLEVSEDESSSFQRRIPLIITKGEDETIFNILVKYIDYGDEQEVYYNFLVAFTSGSYIEIEEYMDVPDYEIDDSRFGKIKKGISKLHSKKKSSEDILE